MEEAESFLMKAGDAAKRVPKAFKANRDRLQNLSDKTRLSQKKGEKELRDLAEETQMDKLATQSLTKELMQSKDLEVTYRAPVVA